MAGRLTPEDMIAVQDLIGRYNWTIDAGDGAGYAALWTADGVLSGLPNDGQAKGPAALAGVAEGTSKAFGGDLRHHMTDVVAEYGDDHNTARAKGRNVLVLWRAGEGATFFGLAESAFVFVREGDGWKIKSNHLSMKAQAPI